MQSPRMLPTINGYTVDLRLRQFRRVVNDDHDLDSVEFVDFDSPEAQELLDELESFAMQVLKLLYHL